MKKNRFTMIELLVVIGIIGILATLILGSMGGGVDASNRTKAKAEMAAYIAERISAEVSGVTVDPIGADPWGADYSPQVPTKDINFEIYKITSAGPDGNPGTKDDVYSWKD